MKIAFITNKFPQLSETFVLNQITGLIDRGHEVDIYAHNAGNDPKAHEDVNRYDLLRHTQYFGTAFPSNTLLRRMGRASLLASNIFQRPVALSRSFEGGKFHKDMVSRLLTYSLSPFSKQKKYDIVSCHFGPNGNLGIFLRDVGAVSGKMITTFHGYDITQYLKMNGNEEYASLFEKGDLFMPISERWRGVLIALGCNPEKIIVHRMGIDINKYPYEIRKKKDNNKICIVTIARLVEKKGVHYGIQAISKVLQKYPDVEYKIIGDGPLRDDLKKLITDLNINDNVTLLGWMQREEIVDLMKGSDVFMAPSVTAENGDQEGIPVVLMEAMAQGLPVISTLHSGIPELVQDGISGFLVPERDADALAEKLIYLIEHPALWPVMGQAGRANVEKSYDINNLNDRLVDLFQCLLNVTTLH